MCREAGEAAMEGSLRKKKREKRKELGKPKFLHSVVG